jgi:predicted phosphodiesterase
MKILHFSDIHFWKKEFDWKDGLYPKRSLGFINLCLRRHRKFPPHLAREAAARIAESDADYVLFSGDISTMSLSSEFAEGAKAFAAIRNKWQDRFVVIPGNHDRYTPRSVREQRFEHHFPYTLIKQGEGKVGRLDIDQNLSVVGFDCSEPFMIRSNGMMRPALVQQLSQVLASVREDGRRAILMGHFPYAAPAEQESGWDHKLLNAESLDALVKTYKPLVYLHGHKHARWCIRPQSTPDTLCINSGSAGMMASSDMKQAGFVEFETSGSSIRNLQACILDQDGLDVSQVTMAIP